MTLRFGTDGVRGVANAELTVELVTALGRAAVARARRRAAVRRRSRHPPFRADARSRARRRHLRRGRRRRRSPVSCPRPVSRTSPASGAAPAAVISASHNPFEDNGVKLFAPGGRKIPEQLEAQVEAELRALATEMPEPGAVGRRVWAWRASTAPRSTTTSRTSSTSLEGRRLDGLQVVVDCGNGAAFRAAPAALRALGADGRRAPRVARRHQHQRGLRLARTPTTCRTRCSSPAPSAGLALRRRRRPRDRGRRARRRWSTATRCSRSPRSTSTTAGCSAATPSSPR